MMNKHYSTIGMLLLLALLMVGLAFISKTDNKHEPIDNIQINHPEPPTPDTIHLERATRYNPVKEQCDRDPLTTADGSKIDLDSLKRGRIRWCALSRDLIYDEYRQGLHSNGFRGIFEFGDTVHVHSESTPMINGWWVVHDCMNARYKNSIDFLFPVGAFSFGVIKDCKIITPSTSQRQPQEPPR